MQYTVDLPQPFQYKSDTDEGRRQELEDYLRLLTVSVEETVMRLHTRTTTFLDLSEVFNDKGDLKIQPDVQGDVIEFGDKDVDNTSDGRAHIICRMAAEGNAEMHLYVDQYRQTQIKAVGGNSRLVVQVNDTYYDGNVVIGRGSGTNNETLRLDGYLTAKGSKSYAQWQVSDTADYLELTREDTNILGFRVNMPFVLDYVGAAPGTLVNGMCWMEADGLHIYYNGAEKLVAGV